MNARGIEVYVHGLHVDRESGEARDIATAIREELVRVRWDLIAGPVPAPVGAAEGSPHRDMRSGAVLMAVEQAVEVAVRRAFSGRTLRDRWGAL